MPDDDPTGATSPAAPPTDLTPAEPAPPSPTPAPVVPEPKPVWAGWSSDPLYEPQLAKVLVDKGLESDPKRAAQLITLQARTGLPTEFIDRNFDDVQKASQQQDFSADKYLKNSPGLAAWLKEDPARIGLTRNDLPKLTQIEALLRSSPDFRFQADGSIVEQLPGSGLARRYDSLRDLRNEMRDRDNAQAVNESAQTAAADYLGYFGWFKNAAAGAIGATGGAVGAFQHFFGHPDSSQDTERAVQAVGAASQANSSGVFGDIQRGVGSLFAQLPLMLTGGEFVKGAQIATDSLIGADTAAPILRHVINGVAGMQPLALEGAFEKADKDGLAAGLESWAVDSGVAGAFGPLGITRAAARFAGAELPSEGAKNAAWTLFKHAGMTATENDAFDLGHRLTDYANGNADAFAGYKQNLIAQSILGAGMGAVGALPEVLQASKNLADMPSPQQRQIATAIHAATSIREVADLANSTESMALHQDSIRDLIGRLAQYPSTKSVWFDARDWLDHFSKTNDAAARASEATGDPEAFRKALSLEQMINVPIERFVTALSDEKHADWLTQEFRTNPDALNAREAVEKVRHPVAVPDEVQEQSDALATAAVAAGPADDRVQTAIAAASRALGTPLREAGEHGRVLGGAVRSLAKRMGFDPKALLARINLKVRGEEGQGLGEPHIVKGRNVVVADVPYGGGTSQDGKTVYIDRRIPRFHEVDGKRIDLHAMIAEHEIAEKERMDRGETYSKAHGQALAVEDKDVDHQGVSHADYENLLKPYLDQAKKEAQKEHIPADIEPKPYHDMNETHLIEGASADPERLKSGQKPFTQPPLAIQPKSESLRSEELLKQWRKAMGDSKKLGGSDLWMQLQEQAFQADDKRGVYYQGASGNPGDTVGAPRGTFMPARLSSDNANTITLLAKKDRSTFFHEAGHLILETMHELAAEDNAPQQIKDDLGKIRKWLGAEDGGGIESITREQHEQFARAFETYLMEGKPPSEALRGSFRRIGKWLLEVYKQFTDFGVPLSDDIRGVFDRILATDEEISQAKASENVRPLFTTPEEAKKTPEQFAKYQDRVERADDEAKQHVLTEAAAAVRRKETKSYQDERDRLHAQTSAEVDKLPVYRALSAMQDGVVPDGMRLDPGQTLKLSRADLVEQFGPDILKRLPGPREGGQERPNAGRHVYADDGMTVEDAAKAYGFPTGSDLVRELIAAPDREAHINAMVDGEMGRRHPDPVADGNLGPLAREGVHSPTHGDVLHDELTTLRTLSDKPSSVPSKAVLRAAAKRTVDKTSIAELSPKLYLAASRKASDLAAKAFRNGDHDAAGDAKQQELLNHELYRSALSRRDEVTRTRGFLRSMGTSSVRRDIVRAAAREGAGPDYMGQIDGLLSRFDLAPITRDDLNLRQAIGEWVKGMQEEGKSVVIPEQLANESFRKNWKQLTSAEFLSLGESVKNIKHLADRATDVTSINDKLSKEELITDLGQSATDNGHPPRKPGITPSLSDEWARKVDSFSTNLTKLSFALRDMDGGKAGGVWWKTFMRSLNDAEHNEILMKEADAKVLMEARRAWGKDAGLDQWNSPYIGHYDPVLDDRISLIDRIHMALNSGTAKNRERLLTGHGLTPDQLKHVHDSLDTKDWDYVRAIWDLVGSKKEALESQSRRLSGVVPDWQEGIPIHTRDGIIDGKYFPIKYDNDQSVRFQAFSTDPQTTAFSPKTRSGFLDRRADTTGRVLKLDDSVITQHLAEVAHRLTHEDAVQAMGKLLRDQDVYKMIADNFGVKRYRLIRDTVLRVAQGDYSNNENVASGYLRRGVTLMRQAYNLMTTMYNATGVSQSLSRVGPANLLKSVAHYLHVSPEEMRSRIQDAEHQSTFLATRSQSYLREQREMLNQQTLSTIRNPITRFAYTMQRFTQTIADHIVWRAAFEKFSSERPELENKDLVAMADQEVIDTQSSGSMKDLVAAQTGSELNRWLTMFYTWSSSRFNLTTEAWRQSVRTGQDIGGVKGLAAGSLQLGWHLGCLYTLPIVVEESLRHLIRSASGGQQSQKDKDESMVAWLAKEHLAQFMSTMPGVRELANAVTGHPYRGPAMVGPLMETENVVREVMAGDPEKIKADAISDILGVGLHLPIAPMSKLLRGWEWSEKHNANPVMPMIFGPPGKN